VFLKCEQILPPQHFRGLSPNAKRVYATVWNRLNNYGSDSIWLMDSYLIERTRIRPEQLGPALSELSRAQLLEMLPGKIQSRYKVIDPDSEQNELQD
jgi:hypothetical protein